MSFELIKASTPSLSSLVAVHVMRSGSKSQLASCVGQGHVLTEFESSPDHIVTLELPLCRDEEIDDWDNWQHKSDKPVNSTSSANLAPTAPGLCIIA